MKLDADVIAEAALGLLDEVGLEGLTMRKVATVLGVQAPALYWHVKNKRELLDAMARAVFRTANADVEGPRQGEDWQDWLRDIANRLRSSMLRYRDGARVLAGTYVNDESIWRTIELALRTLEDAGFAPERATRVFANLLHFTIGFVIEEQSRWGLEYPDGNPYVPGHMVEGVDASRFSRTAVMVARFSSPADMDLDFDEGLTMILVGAESLRT